MEEASVDSKTSIQPLEYHQNINLEEDGAHEFKLATNATAPWRFQPEGVFCTNIVAFLNSKSGGKLYVGVDDQGVVEGVYLTRKSRDQFRQGIYAGVCRSINPPVLPDLVDVTFVPVVGVRLTELKHTPKKQGKRSKQSKKKQSSSDAEGDISAHQSEGDLSSLKAGEHGAKIDDELEIRENGNFYVVIVSVKSALSPRQPIPYENSRNRAFIRLPGSTVAMTGAERIELYERLKELSLDQHATETNKPRKRVQTRTCIIQ